MNALEQQIWDEEQDFAERRRQEYLGGKEAMRVARENAFYAEGGILFETEFNNPPEAGYSVEVDKDGVTVYSECCADRMSRETAIALRNAINTWLERTEEN